MKEKDVCHDNNTESSAVGLDSYVEDGFEVRICKKGIEVLGRGGEKLVKHFVEKHGKPTRSPTMFVSKQSLTLPTS